MGYHIGLGRLVKSRSKRGFDGCFETFQVRLDSACREGQEPANNSNMKMWWDAAFRMFKVNVGSSQIPPYSFPKKRTISCWLMLRWYICSSQLTADQNRVLFRHTDFFGPEESWNVVQAFIPRAIRAPLHVNEVGSLQLFFTSRLVSVERCAIFMHHRHSNFTELYRRFRRTFVFQIWVVSH